MPEATTHDGVRIHYEVHGNGGLPILFMHGLAGSGVYFAETLEHLNRSGLRAVTIDLRGFGDSDGPESGYDDERIARDALTVADAIGAEQFVVLGFSMSGRFAQYVSLLAGRRALGQILVAGCPAMPVPVPEEVRRDWVSRAGDADRWRELLRQYTSREVPESAVERFAQEAAKAAPQALDGCLATCMHNSFADRLSELRLPTLIVGGLHDPLMTPEGLREGVLQPLPCARLVLLDCNHEIPLEQPRELAAVIEAFVAGLGQGVR